MDEAPRRVGVRVASLAREERAGLCGLAGFVRFLVEGVPLEPMAPFGEPAHHVGPAGDAVPQRTGNEARRVVARGAARMASNVGDIVACERAVGEAKERDQRTSGHAFTQRRGPRAVHRDAGRAEVFVQQARVRHCVAVHDCHSVQRFPSLDATRDVAYDDARFVVGVGTAEDAVAGRHGCG